MKKEETEELDIAGLLALKAFEHPDAEHIEKNVQTTMQAVRASHKQPSLHFFPDKSPAWMFAQPRYGIAALFVIFLGLHLLQRPMPDQQIGVGAVEEPGVEMDMASVVQTNQAPSTIPAMSKSSLPVYSSLVHPVSFTE